MLDFREEMVRQHKAELERQVRHAYLRERPAQLHGQRSAKRKLFGGNLRARWRAPIPR